MLKYIGPRFDIELEAAGKINAVTNSKFESVSINQTLHKIYLDLATSIGILTPIGTYSETINSEVLLTEAIIVGRVPENYYNLEGLNTTDSLEVIK